MSLGLQYSSDEEEIVKNVSKDAFGLSSLPQAKKPRVEETSLVPTSADAAPHVLSEVCFIYICAFEELIDQTHSAGSLESQDVGYSTNGHPDER